VQTKPSLNRIVTAIVQLRLPLRKRAVQGVQPRFSDTFILALAVYQNISGFKFANAMLENLQAQGIDVPATSTFSERKKLLLGNIVVCIKALCQFAQKPVRVHMDSKKLPVAQLARASRVKLPGAVGWDAINKQYFYGLRVHGSVDDTGWLRKIVLGKANQADVKVAPKLLSGLSYTVATGDKGYIDKKLKAQFAKQGVDVVTKARKNQQPISQRENRLLEHHRQVETTFSGLDLGGLVMRVYRKPWGLVFHIMSVVMADFLKRLFGQFPSLGLLTFFLASISRIRVIVVPRKNSTKTPLFDKRD
jgi:Transposase DDE domain